VLTFGSRTQQVRSLRRVFPRFPECEYVEIAFRDACISPRPSKGEYRRVDRLVGQLERAEMNPETAARSEIEMRTHGFFRVNVVLTHEPAWLVRAYRKQRQIDARKPAPDFGEVRTVTRIAGEINDHPSGLDDESAPETAIAITQSA
jgi:hypothetical protein